MVRLRNAPHESLPHVQHYGTEITSPNSMDRARVIASFVPDNAGRLQLVKASFMSARHRGSFDLYAPPGSLTAISAPPAEARASEEKPYSLSKHAPITRLSGETFERELDAMEQKALQIASQPNLFPASIVNKAAQMAEVSQRFGSNEDDDANTRYFAYQLGSDVAALMKTQSGVRLDEFMSHHEEPDVEQKFGPGREASSIVDVMVSHPLATGGAESLLQHVLNHDGADPLLVATTITDEATTWHHSQGFETAPGNDKLHVLDPRRRPDTWQRNEQNELVRVGKPNTFLTRRDDD